MEVRKPSMSQHTEITETEQLPQAVRRLLAENEIRQVLYDYCRGVDRLEPDLIRSIYHEDAYDMHSARFSGPGKDFADYVMESFPARGYTTTSHHVTQSRIDFADDDRSACVESYFIAAHSDGKTISWMLGRYLDKFEARNGAWKIVSRRVVHDLNYLTEIVEAYPPANYLAGAQGRSDPSYAEFGW
jgi:SnoaL-like domain